MKVDKALTHQIDTFGTPACDYFSLKTCRNEISHKVQFYIQAKRLLTLGDIYFSHPKRNPTLPMLYVINWILETELIFGLLNIVL